MCYDFTVNDVSVSCDITVKHVCVQCHIGLWPVAQAYVFFEKLALKVCVVMVGLQYARV